MNLKKEKKRRIQELKFFNINESKIKQNKTKKRTSKDSGWKKKKFGKGSFHWTWERNEMHLKNIVSNIFEKHLLAHCVLWSTTMDQNTRVIYSNTRKSDQFEQHAIVRLPSSVEHNRTHYKVLSIDLSIAGHLFADYERNSGSNKMDQKLIRKLINMRRVILLSRSQKNRKHTTFCPIIWINDVKSESNYKVTRQSF